MKPQLIQDYVQTGEVIFEYRNLAFLGDESIDAADAALCANDQGKFWDFHDGLFYNQVNDKPHNSGAFHRSRLDRIAESVGLDTTEFGTCMDNHTYEDQIDASAQEAAQRGIQSTPSFLVNDQLIVGGNYDDLRTAIDTALAAGN